MCGLEIELEGEQIVTVRGDDRDPLSRGHICPKGPAIQGLHEDPDRLRRPLRRDGERWEEIGWDEAIALAVEGMARVQREHGRDALGMYLGNPTLHSLGAVLYGPELLKAIRTKNVFSASSVDQLPQMVAAYEVFGHRLLMPVPDIDHTHHMLIFGANPVVSNGSIMSAPGIKDRLRAIQTRGGKVVVVDPRRTETAALADDHHFIRPGADAMVLLAMLNVLFADGLVDLGTVRPFANGLELVERSVAPFTPERAAGVSGMSAATIRELARELAAAPAAVVYGRVGVSVQAFGTLCAWAIDLLNALTGNLDRRGGAMFTTPAFDIIGGPRPLSIGRGSFGRYKSRVRGLPEFGRELPVAALAEEILEPGEGQIRGMFTSAGNPVLSTPNGRQLDDAFASLEFMVSVDFYLNETTRHADVILPPAGPLERAHFDVGFNLFAVRNVAKYSPALFEIGEDQREDWEIFIALERGLRKARGDKLGERVGVALRERLTPEGILEMGLRAGPWGFGAGLREGAGGLSMAKLRAAPHGVDLGPLQPCLPDRLPARNGRRALELAPASILADLSRLDATFPTETSAGAGRNGEPPALVLIGRRQLRSNNSWMHNVPKLMAGKQRCTLWMHPDDARARGVEVGARVRLRSRVGELEVTVEHDEDLMPGVVCMPHGFGHGRRGVRMRIAEANAGVSVNDITDHEFIDALSGNAALTGLPVTVEANP